MIAPDFKKGTDYLENVCPFWGLGERPVSLEYEEMRSSLSNASDKGVLDQSSVRALEFKATFSLRSRDRALE